MMPMVFSATALSMPAFATSRPINSSILPRLNRLLAGYRLWIHLDLARNELQAMTAFEGAIHIQTRASVAPMQASAGDSRHFVAAMPAPSAAFGRKHRDRDGSCRGMRRLRSPVSIGWQHAV